MTKRSNELFEQAKQHIPGGVNSPVRAFKSVGGNPIFIKKAAGTYLYDEDDNKYIDCIASWGPMILGHAYPKVTAAIQEQVTKGTSYGAPTELEIKMAELIKSMVPNVDLIRMVNSGTEACMSAIRLARGYTGKNKFIKFDGCYHGHADAFLVKAGSGMATLNIQNVPGISDEVAQDTLVAPYNDLEAVKTLVAENKDQIAAIIIEPVAGNMGCILPAPGFVDGLRKICDEEKIVFIFDEVMTGFRLSAGGAQQTLNVNADLITYGKIIGAGLPVGAFGGKREIMECIAPLGKVYQAGTLSGNPLAMIAGYTLLAELKNNSNIYEELSLKTEKIHNGLQEGFNAKNIPVQINRMGSMISVHFSKNAVTDFATAANCDMEMFKKYFHFNLDNGVYLPPSPFESWFLNNALSEDDVQKIINVAEAFCTSL
ncbi:MAG: glutamate-1-semialdehyde 2,1-aminomutase [Ferruginibacter sp.]